MLAIRLTNDDVRRVRLAPGPDPLLDTMLSARGLLDLGLPTPMRTWGRDARRRLDPTMRPLFDLMSASGFPDFLTPESALFEGPGDGPFRAGVRAIVDTPQPELERELDPLGPTLTAWGHRLRHGDLQARRELGLAVHRFHDGVVRTELPAISRWFAGQRAVAAARLADCGVDAFLANLHPDIVWSGSTLTYQAANPSGGLVAVDTDGRGLMTYPSPFTSEPLVMALPGQPVVLILPLAQLPAAGTEDPTYATEVFHLAEAVDALSELLGRTRADVLVALSTPGSTSQVARRLGIAASSVSEHAAVLRRAGLVVSRRRSGSMLHTHTALGSRLVADVVQGRSGGDTLRGSLRVGVSG